MKIAIIDDEPSMRDQLENYILQFAASQQLDLKSVQFPSADAFLLTGGHSFDIIIFDIDMPGTSGLNAARKIRETDENTVILFVTNIAQYAINGYEVDAVDYIIKPVGYYDFIMKFRKAVRRAERIYGSQIVIDTVKGPVGLSTDSILYVEVMAHYVIYHTHSCLKEETAEYTDHEGYWVTKQEGNHSGKMLWDNLFSQVDNIRLVICGHTGRPAKTGNVEDDFRLSTAYRADRNKSGKTVHQMMFNVQTVGGGWEGNGGDGWLRILEFMPDGKTIKVRTYSPLFGISPSTRHLAHRTASYDQFDMVISERD